MRREPNFLRAKLPCLMVAACLAALSLDRTVGGETIAVGKPYPSFLLPRLDNRAAVRLSDFRGQKVLLIQFASW